MERSRGLDGGELKLLAAASMLCDHVGMLLLPQVLWLRCVGRLAFPIFAFLVAEGYVHTHNFRNYLGRMAICAAVSEIPFDLAGGSVWDIGGQNVLVTFCIALLTLRGMDALRRERGWTKYVGMTAAAAVGWLAGQLAMTDYGGWGVLTVVLFYLCREGKYARLWFLAGMALLNGVCLGGLTVQIFGGTVPIQILGMGAVPLVWLYNGKRGAAGGWKWAFYAFYPAHLLVLEGIRALL